MWGVGRNEDGDDSGWGSRTFFAPSSDLSDWRFTSDQSHPWIYESPKMFRHGSELYLVARTDPDGPFWSRDNPLLNILPAWEHHLADLVSFSFRQHGTGLWRLDRDTGELSLVLQLAGCGDTAFPSIVRSVGCLCSLCLHTQDWGDNPVLFNGMHSFIIFHCLIKHHNRASGVIIVCTPEEV